MSPSFYTFISRFTYTIIFLAMTLYLLPFMFNNPALAQFATYWTPRMLIMGLVIIVLTSMIPISNKRYRKQSISYSIDRPTASN